MLPTTWLTLSILSAEWRPLAGLMKIHYYRAIIKYQWMTIFVPVLGTNPMAKHKEAVVYKKEYNAN